VPERKALLAAYARVVAGRPQVLLITGAAGIGKTTLVEELCAQAESAAGGARVLLGESAPLAGAALAYGPFVAALRDQAGWLLDDDRTPDMLAARHSGQPSHRAAPRLQMWRNMPAAGNPASATELLPPGIGEPPAPATSARPAARRAGRDRQPAQDIGPAGLSAGAAMLPDESRRRTRTCGGRMIIWAHRPGPGSWMGLGLGTLLP